MERSAFHQAMGLIESEYLGALHHRAALQASTPGAGRPPDPRRIALESRVRRRVDDACLEFAYRRRLPAMTPLLAGFVFDRFDSGYELCNWALRRGVCFPRDSVGGLVRLFLVEFWFYSGRVRWQYGWVGVLP